MMRALMPDVVLSHVNANASFTVSGYPNRHQGADFVHEEVNRDVKSFLPPGMPTPEIWLRVCRNTTVLKDMKQRAIRQVLRGSMLFLSFTSEGIIVKHARVDHSLTHDASNKFYSKNFPMNFP